MEEISNGHIRNELEEIRNRYPLRLHRGISKKIIQHKHSRTFYAWLELKPLFTDSIIRADEEVEGCKTSEPKLPYKKMAEFLKIGISTMRLHCKRLKKYKLIHYDKDRNIHFATYDRLAEIFKHDEKRKYKLANQGDTQFLVKRICVFENLAKQDYAKRKKMFHSELFDILFERSRDSNNSQNSPLDDNALRRLHQDHSECTNYFSKNEIKKLRRHFNQNYEDIERKHQKIFEARIEQLAEGYPKINMQTTLSHSGISRIFGRQSGQYQIDLMKKKNMLSVDREIQYIGDQSPAIYEKIVGGRSDVFSFDYHFRKEAKTVRKYFLRCPDIIRPVFPESFIDDNFLWKETKSRICHLTDRKSEIPFEKDHTIPVREPLFSFEKYENRLSL